MLESLEKLRELSEKTADYRKIAYNEWTSYLSVSEMNELKKAADAIQAEVDANYLELPKDEDGVLEEWRRFHYHCEGAAYTTEEEIAAKYAAELRMRDAV